MTHGHEKWVITERMRSQAQVLVEMGLLCRAGCCCKNRVKRSVLQEELGSRAVAPSHQVEPAEINQPSVLHPPTKRGPRGGPRT